ncbi:hypothetical protein CN380_14370 [Bacillus sp. AFS017274]|nr:hypothetical protein CN380_14370 [Bacillus sp. AFS017274]
MIKKAINKYLKLLIAFHPHSYSIYLSKNFELILFNPLAWITAWKMSQLQKPLMDFRTTWIAGLLAGTLFTFCMYDSLSFNSSFIVLTKWNPQHVKK